MVGVGRLGRRSNTRTVCINRCVSFCFESSGPVPLHVKGADGASERLRPPRPLPSGGSPFPSGAWNTELREGQKDTASKSRRIASSSSKEDCSFKHEDSGRNREVSFILWFATLPSEIRVNISEQELDIRHMEVFKRLGVCKGNILIWGRKFHLLEKFKKV